MQRNQEVNAPECGRSGCFLRMDKRPAMKGVERIAPTGALALAIAAGVVGCRAGVGARAPNLGAARTAGSMPPSGVATSAPNPSVAEPASPIPSNTSDVAAAPPSKVPAACTESPPYAKSARSPDGKTIIFVHEDPSRISETGAPHQDLCVVTDGSLPRVILEGRREKWDVNADGDAQIKRILEDFRDFLFSPDGKTLYFTSAAWGTETAAHALDLATGKERSLDGGRVVRVLTRGPEKGNLVIQSTETDRDHDVNSPEYLGRIPIQSIARPDGTFVRWDTEFARWVQKAFRRTPKRGDPEP